MAKQDSYIRWFGELHIDDIPLVGGKNASLGEMYQELGSTGVKVPNGFAISADAFRDTLSETGADRELKALFTDVDPGDQQAIKTAAERARKLIDDQPFSQQLKDQITQAYQKLREQYGEDLSVAVRSSATAEDLPDASFAGQHDSYLNICGEEDLFDACSRCFASLYNERAVVYRINNGFDHFKVAISVGVMKMVRSDLASSGVMFSIDTESGFHDAVFITGIYGLGENIVQGTVDPDEFYVHKPTFEQGYRCVLSRSLGSKQFTMVHATEKGQHVRNVATPEDKAKLFCLTGEEILTLADCGIKIEKHYTTKHGHDCPMDIEWAKDGIDNELYIIQARPETVVSQRAKHRLEKYQLDDTSKVLATGRAVGSSIVSGAIRNIRNNDDLKDFIPGEILLAQTTNPDWGSVMKNAAAIVTDHGGRTCHAAIVARELGIPAVVGTESATQTLQNGQVVTVSCAEGESGHVYDGALAYSKEELNLNNITMPKTKIMLNVGTPERAFALSFIPNAGVGLARMEFIINESIKAHPMALLNVGGIENAEEKAQIEKMIAPYGDGREFFISKLAEGCGTIAAAFYPKPVIVRMSDFKSNEYAGLLGGSQYEPKEENPMIGFRGASRYSHPAYEEGFALECAAMKRVRDDMGLHNLKLMIPFCRRLDEAKTVLATMDKYGLHQGENGLQIYVMCEIPNNVILIDEFAQLFDGISIGSNDLTQLTLGVDRDSEIVAFDFDERDPGVMKMIRLAIEGAHRQGKPIGICGQAPSDYPEVAEQLVRLGINSMSLNPDAVFNVIERVVEIEESSVHNSEGEALLK